MTTLDYRMQRIVEKWVYAAAIVPNSGRPTTILKNRRDPAQRVELDPGPRRPQHPQRGRGRRRLPDRRGARLHGVGVVHVEGQQEVPAPVRRAVRRLSPARVVDQAAGLPDRDRRPDDDRGDHVHGRGHELREPRLAAVLPDPGRRRGARPGPAAQRPAVLAEHPRGQGRDHQRHRPRVQQVPGLRAVVPGRHRARRVREHRHARCPPDRHDQRLWRDRGRRRPDAAPHDPEGARLERQPGVAAQQRQADGRARSRRDRPPTSSPTSWPATRSAASTRSGASGASRTA